MGLFGNNKKNTPPADAAESAASPDPAPAPSEESSPSSPPPDPLPPPAPSKEIVHVDQAERLAAEYEKMISPTLSLDGNSLSLSAAGWHLDTDEVAGLRDRIKELEGVVAQKDADIEALQGDGPKKDNQANALKFKNEVLLDMLAVASADEKKSSAK